MSTRWRSRALRDAPQIGALPTKRRDGQLFGVWNTDDAAGLRLVRSARAVYSLEGRKILASGAGAIARPLVTATTSAAGG